MSDEEERIGENIEVWSEDLNEWLGGHIEEYHPDRGWLVQFYNGESNWLENLNYTRRAADDGIHIPLYSDDNGADDDQDLDQLNNLDGSGSIRILDANQFNLDPENADDANADYADEDPNEDHDHTSFDDNITLRDPPPHGLTAAGSLTSVTNLPALDPSCVGIFFKILYTADTKRSAVFRCKTIAYTSSVARNTSEPKWGRSSFKFEMELPPSSPCGMVLAGDIIFVLYAKSASGSSDQIGEVHFDLGE